MFQQIPQTNTTATAKAGVLRGRIAGDSCIAFQLTNDSEKEVLSFLAERPLQTITLTGFIRDNGLAAAANRGTFHGVRNDRGQLEGVALIGHATLMETRTQRAVQAFAAVAQKTSTTHIILGEQDQIEEFWSFYENGGQEMRLACRESLFELREPIEKLEEVPGLRLATLEELDLIVPVHAEMASVESGINPLDKDADGFRERCKRRIEMGRTWILLEDDTLIFKAEVISATKEVVYLEGVWVNEKTRGAGYGVRCLSQLSRELLKGTKSISLLVDQTNQRAQAFYGKCGFKFLTTYDTIFLEQEDDARFN